MWQCNFMFHKFRLFKSIILLYNRDEALRFLVSILDIMSSVA
jgi:hypothetical protein